MPCALHLAQLSSTRKLTCFGACEVLRRTAPKAYTDMLIRKGKAAANGNISPAKALSSFVNGLENRNIAHSILNDTDVNGNEVVSSVVFHDEQLAPTMLHPCSVYTTDVTFGLTGASCGFAKWSFLSRLLQSISLYSKNLSYTIFY